MTQLRIARVADVHPEDHSVDLVMVDDGSRHAGVQVASPHASSDSGVSDLPKPGMPASGDKWSLTEATDRDMIALVAFVGRRPVVTGFLYPQVGQMSFADPNRRVQRHASGVYSTIDAAGNFEMAWPNGLFMRVGSSPTHEDLNGKDVDGKWKQSANTAAQLYVRLELPGGNAVVTIEPSGKLTITNKADIAIASQGNIGIAAQGDLTLSAAGTVKVQGVTTVTGSSLTHNGKNVGSTHAHSGVVPGGGNTGAPV